MKKISLLISLVFLVCFSAQSQELISYSSVNNPGCSGIINNDPDVVGTGICRGPGVTNAAGATFTTEGWTTTTNINFTDYLEWSLEASPGNLLDLSSLIISYRRGGGFVTPEGPTDIDIRVNYGTGYNSIFTDNTVTTSLEERTIFLNSIPTTSNSITFRLYGFNSENNGDFEISETSLGLNKGIVINGTVTSQNCSDLFISEYIEGSSNNKYIEIYNPTNVPVSMNQYDLAIYFNGSTIAGQTILLPGFIGPYDVYIIENSAEGLGITADLSTIQLNFNGDDAVALRKAGTVIDVIGEIGLDPGSEWDDGTCSQGTQNGTLVRNSTVQFGDTDGSNAFVPSDEWTCYAQDDVSNLGVHTSDCQGPSPEIQLVDNVGANQNCGYTIDFGNVPRGGSFTDLTFDITNVGSEILTISNLQISGDYAFVAPPPTPFDIAPGNSITLTIRFTTPVFSGPRPGLVRIFNNDTDESPCEINLTGVSFTPAPEIDIERNTGASIPDGSAANPGFNTIFAATVIGNSSAPKTYFVSNEGTANLNLNNIISSNPAEFSINLNPSPALIAPGTEVEFEITFTPIGIGTRTGTISILSNDLDENPYRFDVRGTGDCAAGTLTFLPNSGPVNTIVTVTTSSTNFGGATTATINGLPATVNVISNSEIEVTIPSGATTGTLEITDDLGCVSFDVFTVIDEQISSCEGTSGSAPTDLFISEVTDHGSGSHSYVEIYNGTGATVDLTDYEIRIHNNGASTATNTIPLVGSVLNNDVFVLAFGSTDATNPYSVHGFDQSDNASGINEDDNIQLYFTPTNTWIDVWGDTSGNTFTVASRNYTYRRKNSGIIAPNTYGDTTWNVNDWDSFTPVDYSEIGTYDFSLGVPPTVTGISSSTTSCNEVTISVSASQGFVGGNLLDYAWFFYDPANAGSGWQLITNGGIYNGADTANLVITDAASVVDYQFYCQVREDDATCFTASDAVQITISTATWDGVNWNWNDGTAQNTLPNLSTNVVINGNYSTGIGGIQTSFSACNLIVIGGNALTIDNNTFIQIQNNIIANGDINVSSQGSVVQIDDSGTVSGSGVMQVTKRTAPMNNAFEYTYWSSPVSNATINSALAQSDVNRRFIFNAQNYLDATAEIGNNNATVAGQDDIDDNGDDWTLVGGATTMEPGVGYASAHDPTLFASTPGVPPYQFDYIFEGTFNTGVITVPIYRNDSEMADNNWNFIGNPYPSAIDADDFLTFNSSIAQTVGATNGAIFLWSQNTAPDGNANGNQNLNFAQGDYAIINGTGETAGGDGISPSRHIPSGQGFFVAMDDAAASTIISGSIRTTDIVFNNSMRVTGNNDLFFRNNFSEQPDKLWLNLTSDNGVFSQILVAYIEGASNNFDGMYYDAFKNKSSNLYSGLYTSIQNSDKKFAIQGKDPNSLSIDEIIEIGFNTSIQEPTIYTISIAQFEGQFLSENPIYLKDKLLNTIHNLKESDYTFTSEAGEFNDRFEIVFQDNALSTNEFDINPNDLKIVELGNGLVEFSIAKNHTIKEVVILDVIGREIYRLPGSSSVEVYNLEKLTKAAYIAQVELSNGQIITKKAIKRN
jgi:hypothetical protein